jgi:hypothetical protein
MNKKNLRHSLLNTNQGTGNREQGTGSVVCKFPLSLFFVLCYLFLVSCADMFQDKISNPGKNDSLDNLFREEEQNPKLQRPQQLYAAPYYSPTEIRLTWTGVRGAAYYMIERTVASPQDWQKPGYLPDDGEYEAIERFVYSTSFNDVILKNASLDAPEYQNKYFYRISAFNTAKKYDESEPTEPVSAMLFNAPDNLSASCGESVDYVMLRWERAAGAESYEIFRSDFPSGVSASSLGIVYGNQTWFQNIISAAEQGKDFYYMVSAKNGFGYKSPLTKPAYGYARVFGAPDMPTVRRADNSGRGQSTSEIKITWDAASETDAYYAVYRYSSVDSSLTRLTGSTDKTEYTDNAGLKTGVYYYYKVQAIVDDIASGKALKSQFSSEDNLTESYILSPPDTVVAQKKSDGKVTVKWEPAIGSEGERLMYTYNIYNDNSINGLFTNTVMSGVAHNVDGEGFISVDGLDVSSGAFFKVSTVNKNNVVSNKSIVVSPAPAAAVILDATKYAYFQGASANAAANSNGVYPVKITWKKPENEEPVFYNVHRSIRSGSGFSTINETALGASGPFNDIYSYDSTTGVYTYTDINDTAKVGRKFYYRVLSLNELKQGNFASSEAIGWGALTHEQYILEYNKTMGGALKKLTLMYKSASTDKLGSETKNGSISGTISYNASLSGLSARIIIRLTNYADFYIENEPDKGIYFILNGNSNTSANTSSNGTMDGTMNCTGMYPGKIYYDRIEIKGGAAGGGTYGVEPEGGSRREIGYIILN